LVWVDALCDFAPVLSRIRFMQPVSWFCGAFGVAVRMYFDVSPPFVIDKV